MVFFASLRSSGVADHVVTTSTRCSFSSHHRNNPLRPRTPSNIVLGDAACIDDDDDDDDEAVAACADARSRCVDDELSICRYLSCFRWYTHARIGNAPPLANGHRHRIARRQRTHPRTRTVRRTLVFMKMNARATTHTEAAGSRNASTSTHSSPRATST